MHSSIGQWLHVLVLSLEHLAACAGGPRVVAGVLGRLVVEPRDGHRLLRPHAALKHGEVIIEPTRAAAAAKASV
eukprot:scaffold227759_cov29-Prasinocladus_malaysianus.AAC.1